MAYVAISAQLMDEVRRKISSMRDTELNALPKVEDTMNFTYAPLEYQQLVWGDHMHLKDIIPDNWKKYVGELYGYAEYPHGERAMKTRICIKLDNKFGAPPNENTSSYSASFPLPPDHHAIAPLITQHKEIQDIRDKWHNISDKVRSFLNNCKSLNEAVKLWPDVRIYVPESYMKRMLVKSERTAEKISKAAEFLKQIDTDAAVAAAVGARMAGAKL